ncbi:MAG: Flp pilus assembly complex ATPase component TadA [Rhodanobacteraceae bacterium]|nr:Flp pilus assembly complex ATPase component TadA [Rhodanobacteraceae bacterium]
MTFARTLRNILRHDPDVVMVGEIRDQGNRRDRGGKRADRPSGVLHPAHNNAATTITRLLDIGVLPFLLKSTMLGVLAQRLGRRNCKCCKVPGPVDYTYARSLGVAADVVFYIGKGCPKCEGRGIRAGSASANPGGHPEINRLIVPGVTSMRSDLAQKQGMLSITRNAVTLARRA